MKSAYETRNGRTIRGVIVSVAATTCIAVAAFVSLPSHATDQESIADARCMIVASRMVTTQDAQQRGAGTLVAMFYLGRLDARNGYTELRRLILEEAKRMSAADLRSEAMRCGKAVEEQGRRLSLINGEVSPEAASSEVK